MTASVWEEADAVFGIAPQAGNTGLPWLDGGEKRIPEPWEIRHQKTLQDEAGQDERARRVAAQNRAADSAISAAIRGEDRDAAVKSVMDFEESDLRDQRKAFPKNVWEEADQLFSPQTFTPDEIGVDPQSVGNAYDYAASKKSVLDAAKHSVHQGKQLAGAIKNISDEDWPLYLRALQEYKEPKERGVAEKIGESASRGGQRVVRNISEFINMLGLREHNPIEQMSPKDTDRWRQIQDIWEGNDPLEGRNWAEQGAIGAANMAPAMVASLAVPGGTVGSTGFWVTQIAPERYKKLKGQGMDDTTAKIASILSAVPEAYVEHMQVSGLKGAAGQKVMNGLRQQAVDISKRLVKRYGEELGEEAIQAGIALASEAAARDVDTFLTGKQHDVNIDDEFAATMDEIGQAALSLPFLMLPGAGYEAATELPASYKKGNESRAEFKKIMGLDPKKPLPKEFRSKEAREAALLARFEADTKPSQAAEAEQAPTEPMEEQTHAEATESNVTEVDNNPYSELEKRRRAYEEVRSKPDSEMTAEDWQVLATISPVTGLPNAIARDRAAPRAYKAMMDADSLKYVNDSLGHDAGNALLRAVGEELSVSGLEAYHPSGDEFQATADNQEDLEKKLEEVAQRLNDRKITYTMPDGKVYQFKALFSKGIDTDWRVADAKLAEDKAKREAEGTRSPRGVKPPSMVEVTPEGRNADNGPAQPGSPDAAPSNVVSGVETSDRGVQYSEGNLTVPKSLEPTKQSAPVNPNRVIEEASKRFGVPIRIGKIHPAKKAVGLYKTKGEVIRHREEYSDNLAVATHEIAHHLDKQHGLSSLHPDELSKLDYDKTKRRPSEGFAEFMRHFLTMDDAQESAPKFYKDFAGKFLPVNKKLASDLQWMRQQVDAWRQQGAEASVEAKLNRTGVVDASSMMDKAQSTKKRLQRAMIDDLAALEEFEKDAVKEGTPAGDRPYVLARVLGKTGAALGTSAVNDGVFSLKDNRRLSSGIKEALSQIKPDEYEAFVRFIYSRHALDVWKTGRNPGIEERDAQFVYDKYKDNERFVAAGDALTAWNKALIDMLAEVGGLSEEAQERIKESFPNYVPLKRAVDSGFGGGKKGYLDVKSPVKGMSKKGSGRDVIDPVAAMVTSATQYYSAAAKMLVAQKVVEMAEATEGAGRWVEKIPNPTKVMETQIDKIKSQLERAGADLTDADLGAMVSIATSSNFMKGSDPVAVVFKDGKPQWYQFDPDLYASLSSMDVTRLPWAMEMTLGAATQLKRAGATGFRASFGLLFNPIRDLPVAMIQTEGSMAKMFFRTIGNVFSVAVEKSKNIPYIGRIINVKADPYAALWRQFGGELSGYIGQDIRKAHRHVLDIMNDSEKRKALNIVMHPLELIQEIFSIPEAAPRIAEFRSSMEARGWTMDRLNSGETPPTGVLVEAMMAANEVSVDFKRMGSLMRMVNRVEAYSNATLQGISQPIRKFKRNPAKFAMRGALLLALPTVAYWVAVKDEDWYDELEPWQRFYFWNFKVGNKIIRIPRPFEHGLVFSGITEAALDSIKRKDAVRAEELAKEFMPDAAMIPDKMLFDAIQPPIEVIVNYSFWREREIVPKGMQNLEPRDQAMDYNTSFSKYIGDVLNASPAKIDHLISQYSGGLGTDVLNIPREGPVRALGFGRLVKPWERGASVNQFYEEYQRINQEYNSAKMNGTVGAELKKRRKKFYDYNKEISKLRKQAKAAKSEEESSRLNAKITGVARKALGKKALKSY